MDTLYNSPRAYTVQEIDQMRGCVTEIWHCNNSSWRDPDRTIQIETTLRTYMLGGVSVQELLDKSAEERDGRIKRMQAQWDVD